MIHLLLRTSVMVLLLSLPLAGCGIKGPLDTPVSRRQATPGTPEDQMARHPPKGEDGKLTPVPTKPLPTPAAKSFPLDFLLN